MNHLCRLFLSGLLALAPATAIAHGEAARAPAGHDSIDPAAAAAPAAPPAHIIVYPAKSIVTLDPVRPTAEAVAVLNGRVLSVGTLEEVQSWGKDRDMVVDRQFEDAVLVPGFIEAHMHAQLTGLLWQGVYIGRFDRVAPDGTLVKGLESKQTVLDRLGKAASALPDDASWLFAWGYQPEYYGDSPLTTDDLDPISHGHPMFIENLSMHIYYVNGKALEIAKVTGDTKEEGIVKKDGKPTGELREISALLDFLPHLPPLSPEIMEKSLRDVGRMAHRVGVTTFTDMNFGSIPGSYKAYQTVAADPAFPVRSVLHPMIQIFEEGEIKDKGGLDYLLEVRKHNNDRLSIGGVKFIVDGSIQGGTALLRWPYYYQSFQNGVANIQQDALNKGVLEVHRRGLQAVIHTNADQATDMGLDAVTAAQKAHPMPEMRHRLEHNQLPSQAQIRRMKELGVATNLFVNHIYYWGDMHYSTLLGPDRAERMNPAGSVQRMGIPFSIHSDASVTPVNPLFAMWVATTRETMSGRVLGESERLTIPQALHAVTLGAAYLMEQDDMKGSIEIGKLADFTVLDRNPLDLADPAELKDIKVLGTVVGGTAYPAEAAQ